MTSIDTVGAGDAFTAGYLSALLDGGDIAERLRRGTLAGAFAVSTAGDCEGLPSAAELALLAPRRTAAPSAKDPNPPRTPIRSDTKAWTRRENHCAEVFVTSPSRNFVTLRITTRTASPESATPP